MNVDFCGEFGSELQLVIPYAYYLHQKNLLKQTISSSMTKELYFFSENHIEKYTKRICTQCATPNKTPHVKELNYDEYIPPPYKSIYKNKYFVYDKPLLIIHNKYNQEWGGPPVNFIDINTLDKIFNLLIKKYTIIYLRPKSKNIVSDNSKIYDLNEKNVLDSYGVINGNELYKDTKEKYNINNFNHFQLLIHANCNKFISIQGGNCVLASYFGGTNIIYAKNGMELKCDSYNGHYKKYSNCNILYSRNYQDFIQLIKKNFAEEEEAEEAEGSASTPIQSRRGRSNIHFPLKFTY